MKSFESLFTSAYSIQEKEILISQYIRKYKLSKYIDVSVDKNVSELLDCWYSYFSNIDIVADKSSSIVDFYNKQSGNRINMFFDSSTSQLYLDPTTKPRPKHIGYTRHFISEIVYEIFGIKVHLHIHWKSE